MVAEGASIIASEACARYRASLGTGALAAHGVTLAIQSLTFNVGFALSVATTALVGQSLGAGRPDLAERWTHVTMRHSLAFVLVMSAGAAWIVRLVPAYLLAITAGLGVPGAWAAAIADINMRALLIFIRFRQGRWKRMRSGEHTSELQSQSNLV